MVSLDMIDSPWYNIWDPYRRCFQFILVGDVSLQYVAIWAFLNTQILHQGVDHCGQILAGGGSLVVALSG